MDRSVHIALVDDEEDVGFIYRALLKRQIKDQTCVLHFFNSANSFLDFLNENELQEEISLLITDINMPNMDGFTLLSILKNKMVSFDCYISSAYGSKEFRDKGDTFAIKGFIEKPIDLELVREIVSKKRFEINN